MTAALVATSLAFGAPAQAQEDPKEERTVIIRERSHGPSGAQSNTEHRDVIRRNLSPEMAERFENCRDDNRAVNVDDREGNQRTRIMICARDGEGSAAGNVEALKRVRERIASEDHLSDEAKARVLAQLDQAIARARQAR